MNIPKVSFAPDFIGHSGRAVDRKQRNIPQVAERPMLSSGVLHPLRASPFSLASFKTLLPHCRSGASVAASFRHRHIASVASAQADSSKKQIAIVGGGLGGLTAARVLQKHGFKPIVFERDTSDNSRVQGAALDLHPESGQWALEQAGLTEEFRAAARPDGQDTRVLDKDGTVLWEEVGSTQFERPEIDRPVLRQMLLDSLQQGTVRWDHHLTSIRPSSNGNSSGGHILEFKNGYSMTADLVIGADGARSQVRGLLTDARPSYTGVSAIMGLIPDADRRHPEAAKTVGRGMLFAMADNKGFLGQRQGSGHIQVWIMFEIKKDGLADIGITLDTGAATRASILDHFSDWTPELTNLVRSCDDSFRLWPCYSMPAGVSWKSRPDITLLGDAAHLMSPFAGEGANLAMQDGAELALALVNNASAAAAIATHEARMFARAQKPAEESASNQALMVSPNGSQQMAEFLRQGMEEASLQRQ